MFMLLLSVAARMMSTSRALPSIWSITRLASRTSPVGKDG